MTRRITSQRELSREMAERLAARASWYAEHPEDAGYRPEVTNQTDSPRLVRAALLDRVATAAHTFADEVGRTASKVADAIDREAVRKLKMADRARIKAEKRSRSNQREGKVKRHGRKAH